MQKVLAMRWIVAILSLLGLMGVAPHDKFLYFPRPKYKNALFFQKGLVIERV